MDDLFKTFEVVATYSPNLYPEFQHTSPERLDELYVETYDRWTWDTGLQDDYDYLVKIDVERHYRKKNNKSRKLNARWSVEDCTSAAMHGLDVEKELIEACAADITAEIDAKILQDLEDLTKS